MRSIKTITKGIASPSAVIAEMSKGGEFNAYLEAFKIMAAIDGKTSWNGSTLVDLEASKIVATIATSLKLDKGTLTGANVLTYLKRYLVKNLD